MSLTTEQLARTAAELQANLELTGLTKPQIAADLGFTESRLNAALKADGGPVDVWLLRDYLVQAVRDAGRTPARFTILTGAARIRAQAWFRLSPAPRHDFHVA